MLWDVLPGLLAYSWIQQASIWDFSSRVSASFEEQELLAERRLANSYVFSRVVQDMIEGKPPDLLERPRAISPREASRDDAPTVHQSMDLDLLFPFDWASWEMHRVAQEATEHDIPDGARKKPRRHSAGLDPVTAKRAIFKFTAVSKSMIRRYKKGGTTCVLALLPRGLKGAKK